MKEYTTVFIDLDQTLYPLTCGIWEDVAGRIDLFLHDQLGVNLDEAARLRQRFHKSYGTTLRGLQQEMEVDPIAYMKFIHDVPIETKISIDPALQTLLESIQISKYIFTNASFDHARRVLTHLGVMHQFDGIIDILSLAYVNKPDPRAYLIALELAGNPTAGHCVLVDDSPQNLAGGSAIGMTTVQVGENREPDFKPDFLIPSILELLDVLPELGNTHPAFERRDE